MPFCSIVGGHGFAYWICSIDVFEIISSVVLNLTELYPFFWVLYKYMHWLLIWFRNGISFDLEMESGEMLSSSRCASRGACEFKPHQEQNYMCRVHQVCVLSCFGRVYIKLSKVRSKLKFSTFGLLQLLFPRFLPLLARFGGLLSLATTAFESVDLLLAMFSGRFGKWQMS